MFLCTRNENLPKKEGGAMSSKAARPHPPIPASPEAQEKVDYVYICYRYLYMYIFL